MLDDLIPILRASQIVPVYTRNAEEAPTVTRRNFAQESGGQGCFRCNHEAARMSVSRRYATTVFYTEDRPVTGVVWSPQDTAYSLSDEQSILGEIMHGDLDTRSNGARVARWWLNREDSIHSPRYVVPYVRKWTDFGTSRNFHVNSRSTDFMSLLTRLPDEEVYSITVYPVGSMYVEPFAFLRGAIDGDGVEIENVLPHVKLTDSSPYRRETHQAALTGILHAMFPRVGFDGFNGFSSGGSRRNPRNGLTRLNVGSRSGEPSPEPSFESPAVSSPSLDSLIRQARINRVATTTTQASTYEDLVQRMSLSRAEQERLRERWEAEWNEIDNR